MTRTTSRLAGAALCAAWACVAVSCSSGNSSPTAPSSPSPSATRIISLSGNLAFGNVLVGSSWTASFVITNSGNSTLTVSSISGPSGFSASWVSGTIVAGASQSVMLGFLPTAPGTLASTFTVNADQTSGVNTIPVTATVFPNMNGAWSGTETVSAIGLSGVCNMTWIVAGQTAAQFSGTWQTSGAGCGQAGNLSGAVDTTDAIDGLILSATVAPSPCTLVSGNDQLNGVLSGSALTAQFTDTINCPGLGTVSRSITVSMTKEQGASVLSRRSSAVATESESIAAWLPDFVK